MSQICKAIPVLISLFYFTACSTSSVSNNDQEQKIETRAPLDGIWVGEFDIRGKGPYDFTAIHLQEKAYAYSLKAKAMCIGTLTFDGEHSLHKYVLFALDGGPFDWATVTGTLNQNEQQQSSLTSHFKTLNGGDTGALDITYNEIYELPSSISQTRGKWSYTDKDKLTTNISIDGEGTIMGDDSDGCNYLGHVEIINPKYNVYRIKTEISECGSTSGEYEGVSYFDDGLFIMQIANPQYALFYAFDRN